MNLIRIYGLFLRHFYLITRSFPRVLDLIYWPTIQITLWGFISNFFANHSSYYSGAVGVILSCAILYDFLFRTSIGFNMLFLEEIWSRNFTNLFIAPLKISEIIISLVFTALIRALIGLIPAILLTSPLFGISLLDNQLKLEEIKPIENKYLNFTLVKNNNKINIFFDNQTLNLIGWQTEDIYQNLVITFIYRVKLNQKIDQDIFKLPEMN